MGAALTETENLITALARSLRQNFAETRSGRHDEDNPDWGLPKATLDRLMDSDSYLRLAESHAVALGATDTVENNADDSEAAKRRRQIYRLVMLDAAHNALASMKHDVSQLTTDTAYAIYLARNTTCQPGPFPTHAHPPQ